MVRQDIQEGAPKAVDDGQSVESSASCTIYSPVVAYDKIWECVRQSGLPFTTEGSIERWDRIVVADASELTLKPLERVKPGDKLSRILLGTINYFRQIQAPEERRRQVIDAITGCQMLVGARGVPDFTDEQLDLLFEIATAIGALIFTGNQMLDGEGRTVLAGDGSYE